MKNPRIFLPWFKNSISSQVVKSIQVWFSFQVFAYGYTVISGGE